MRTKYLLGLLAAVFVLFMQSPAALAADKKSFELVETGSPERLDASIARAFEKRPSEILSSIEF